MSTDPRQQGKARTLASISSIIAGTKKDDVLSPNVKAPNSNSACSEQIGLL